MKTYNLYYHVSGLSRNFIGEISMPAVLLAVQIILDDGGEVTGIIDSEKDA